MLSLGGITRLVRRLRYVLPEGRPLPDDIWRRRHRGILILLWGHAVGLSGFAFLAGYGLQHSLFEGSVVVTTAIVAHQTRLGRRLRALFASLGLVTSSAVLVHLSGGYIEMHFHFFVMMVII